ncbi:phycobilisome Linker polypeptide [Aphanothece hegewaldii CCALA 016]|uniref:Phycobilisome Linker polypeptide n=1 Tax=Aphanothece hegewaldii CCALA 016 TaxID=2107694 RepID=A0A2T1LXS4_9CHRO|nr:phycobilisome rod-core linker polypeptide [Aphanothece hegewaldii]PSF37158.1 phycobilisome Linker polypeptide [Aphanothece hegewaldii CCALA 016]
MTTKFTSPRLGNASELGVNLYEDTAPIQLLPGVEIEPLIQAVYRQVLGNAYVMESERLSIPESRIKNNEITVREFVRQIALSDLYRSRFFDPCSRYRAIELNFKHLLGRAPESYEEMQQHSQILDEGGYEAEIDSYLDSDEYQDAYGEDIVPYYRGYKTQSGRNLAGFTHIFKLHRGASSSDKNLSLGNYSRLNQSLLTNRPSNITPPSGVSTYGGLTDIQKLLSEVLKPKTPTSSQSSYTQQTINYPELQRKYSQQAEQIKKLQSQLSELSSFASIGESGLNKWNSGSASTSSSSISASSSFQNPETALDYERAIEGQAKLITELETKIADSRRLATIGEAKLNKWRSRSY